MKNIITLFKEWQKQKTVEQEKKDFELAINSMMKLAFEKDTQNAIERRIVFSKVFDSEIAKRGLKAKIEAQDCEDYFTKVNKSLNYGKAFK
jgi:hypothetical protein